MPCNQESPEHDHQWPTTVSLISTATPLNIMLIRLPAQGTLIVERCEKTCAFCTNPKPFKAAWFLRRHVRDVHVEQYPNLEVAKGWSGNEEGNAKPEDSNRVTKPAKKTKSKKPKRVKKTPAKRQPVANNPHFAATNPQPTITAGASNAVNAANLGNDYMFNNAMADLPSYGTDMFNDDNALFGGVDFDAPNNLFGQDGSVNPFDLSFDNNNNNPAYVSESPWSTPQSVRISNTVIEADTPTSALDGSPDRLVRRLDHAFHEALESGVMTEEYVLGTVAKFLEAFKHGRAF